MPGGAGEWLAVEGHHTISFSFSLQLAGGRTPLMDAALLACRETASCLVAELGSDPDTLNSAGRPALYCALQANDQKIVEMLCPVTTAGEVTV